MNDEDAKSHRHDYHCRYRAVHLTRHILLQSTKAELPDSPYCSRLSSVHRVVFPFTSNGIEALRLHPAGHTCSFFYGTLYKNFRYFPEYPNKLDIIINAR